MERPRPVRTTIGLWLLSEDMTRLPLVCATVLYRAIRPSRCVESLSAEELPHGFAEAGGVVQRDGVAGFGDFDEAAVGDDLGHALGHVAGEDVAFGAAEE